jgi:glycosyltransferase involved in cell wall biosynthesis
MASYKKPQRALKIVHQSGKKNKNNLAQNKIGILIFSDYNCSTGFGIVGTKLIEELQKDDRYIIVIHAVNDFSEAPYNVGENTKVFPAHLNDKNDYFGRIEFLRRLFDIDWDLCFVLNDVEIIHQLMPHINIVKKEKLKQNRKLFKLACYFPIDSPVLPEVVQHFHDIDMPITYTEYAKTMIENLNPKIEGKIKILSHGVDSAKIFPVDKTETHKIKKEIFGDIDDDVFIFGTVNRNQVRKDMGCILIAFYLLKNTLEDSQKVVLYMHCNPLDSKGFNMLVACERLGLKVGKDVFFQKGFNENNGVSIEELNLIYNIMDVFVTTTTAEGWGLTVTEAMATKTPIICPLHTSLTEITQQGKLVEAIYVDHCAIFLGDFENIRNISNPNHVSAAMRNLMNTLILKQERPERFKILEERTEAAYNFAVGLQWSNITKAFKHTLDKLINRN